ncbi:MAG: hypothetical protein L6V93_15200 [Clostridiales bacterium]|nr:MAG: hypothetical protein L6V93_15200 [Clostridiales bacterium]
MPTIFESNPVIADLCEGRRSIDEFKGSNYIELNRILYEIRSRARVADNVYLYITKDETVLVKLGGYERKKTFYNSNPQYKKTEYSDFCVVVFKRLRLQKNSAVRV